MAKQQKAHTFAEYFKKNISPYNSGGRRPYEVFRDFVRAAKISLHNQLVHFDEDLEKEFIGLAKQYKKDGSDVFSEHLPAMLGLLTVQFQDPESIKDYLGEFFMEMEFGNDFAGQFFTPFHLSEMMAMLLLGDKDSLNQQISENGCIRLQEPAVGSGGMVLANAKAMHKMGIDYRNYLFVEAIDVDSLVADMAYIQLSLAGIPAVVHRGDSLKMDTENWNSYYTPMFAQNKNHAYHREATNEVQDFYIA